MAMLEPLKATPRVRSIQRAALAMLVLAGVINYVDRATLAVANLLIRQDLGLSIADMGYLLSAFLWAYAFAQLPTGAMVDKLGPRLLLACGLGLWSLAQFLGGLVLGFGQFFGARVLLGIGEAPQFPTCARVVRDWFNPRDRGLATGIFNCASSLGTAIAVPLLTFLMLSFGWRPMFMIMGVAGLGMAAIWYFAYRNPTDVALTAEENVYRTQGDPPGQRTKVSLREWKQLFRFRTTWGMILGYFGCIYLTWIYTAWLPGYLEIERHMSVKSTGFAAAIPFVCGVVGGVLGGYFADILVRRGVSPVKSRRIPAAIALCGVAVSRLCHQHLRLGAELGRRPDKLHRFDRRHAELRRLSRRRAGPDRHRADRSANRLVRAGAGRGRADRRGFGGVVSLHRRPADHRGGHRRRLAGRSRSLAGGRR
jgi:sugar phosphate permease